MKRILVIGNSGSGKSSRSLADRRLYDGFSGSKAELEARDAIARWGL